MAKTTHMEIDVLAADATSLRYLLDQGLTSSVEIVSAYVAQIEKWDGYLCAMLSMPTTELLKKLASQLDVERFEIGSKCGPLHGLPIILKVF
jgi:amidase